MDIIDMQREAHSNAVDHGFWSDELADRRPPELLMLIVSEAAEALEAFRDDRMGLWFRDDGKPEGIGSELADIVIRVGDMAGALGIDLDAAVAGKMKWNRSRPYRHGGKLA